MPVVKGGVWTNIEDEILKAAVSKYGLNQWARVSSLLAKKTAKQCKARWTEWLDPAIRKIEWTKEEDEKLLHLAKLMPTQWRTIAPIVGRTATQCLERYQRLLDEAEARENDELGLGGPEGGETAAPTGDDVRKLRPGETDPDPESKPAKPDAIDMDEDEKEMLSEARARLANTQGKKAKRKARERQLEESRRLAVLQKRRELKASGINIRIRNRKQGQMDYNADIPFEKAPAAGFYDTQEEETLNDRERASFDPRKQQLARKRQGEQEDGQDTKRQKQDSNKSNNDAMKAAARAGQLQRIREAEQQSRRRGLNLPAPQVSEAELEEIVKMGAAGERAARASGDSDDRGLISNYSSNMISATPIRTPRAPAQEDHIANEIRNIQALTNAQSSLLGGENTPLHEGRGSTGFEGSTPRRQDIVTPNPMATPLHVASGGVPGGFPAGATPLRTPRDNFAINEEGQRQLVSQTPRDLRRAENIARSSLRTKLSSLPKPKQSEFELEEMPSEQVELGPDADSIAGSQREDQEEIDRREREAKEASARAEFKRQTQVYQRNLPRPKPNSLDFKIMMQNAKEITNPIESLIAQEMALLIVNDASKFSSSNINSRTSNRSKPDPAVPSLEKVEDEYLSQARAAINAELEPTTTSELNSDPAQYYSTLDRQYPPSNLPIFLSSPSIGTSSLRSAFSAANETLLSLASSSSSLETKLTPFLKGYQIRQRTLSSKIIETARQLIEEKIKLSTYEALRANEEVALSRRLSQAREEVTIITRREREAQDAYRDVTDLLRRSTSQSASLSSQ